MLATESSFVCLGKLCCLISNRNATKKILIAPTFAKKKDYSENPTTGTAKKAIFPLSSRNLIIQSAATGVLALGFIDAGYSGDWSRIGVISRETEDLLKAAAFLVVPLCFALIFYLFKNDSQEESR